MATSLNTLIIQLKEQGFDGHAKQLKKMAGLTKNLKNGETAMGTSMVQSSKGVQKMTYDLTKQNGQMMATTKGMGVMTTNVKRFKMEWLGIMFFTMNIQKQLKRVLSSSVQAFMKIAGETDRANQTLASFGAQITFIKFTMGRAIAEVFEPFLPVFVKIVDVIADFIEQNPAVAVEALVGAFVGFLALNIVAQVALVSGGIAQVGTNALMATTAIKALKGMMGVIGIGLAIKGVAEKGLSIENIIAPVMVGLGFGMKAGIWTFAVMYAIDFLMAPEMVAKQTGVIVGQLADIIFKAVAMIPKLIKVSLGIISWDQVFDQDMSKAGVAFAMGFAEQFSYKENIGEDSILGLMMGKEGLNKMTTDTDQFWADMRTQKEMEVEFNKKQNETMSSDFATNVTIMKEDWEEGGNEIISATRTYVTTTTAELEKLNTCYTTTHFINTISSFSGGSYPFRSNEKGTEYIPKTGLYQLHQGEKVTPASQVSMGNINVNVNNSSSSGEDIANAISERLDDELKRYI